mgnify:CR=1 FL=1
MSRKYIGEIEFVPTGEIERFTDIHKFFDTLRHHIDIVGVTGVRSEIYNKNNLDYQYEHDKFYANELGYAMQPKAQYFIEHTCPEFCLSEKLWAIYRYESNLKRKSKLTFRPQSVHKVFLSSHIADTMSVKSIKRLVNRRYEKATRKCAAPVQRKSHKEYER